MQKLGMADTDNAVCFANEDALTEQSMQGRYVSLVQTRTEAAKRHGLARRKKLLMHRINNLFDKSLLHLPLKPETQKLSLHSEGGDHATCYGNSSAGVTMVSLVAGLPEDYVSELLRNRLELAQFGSYEYCQYSMVLEQSRDAAWSKVLAISALLAKGRKTVVWIDADAVMIHPKRFEDVLHETEHEKELTFTNDYDEDGHRAGPSSSINTGVCMTRNSPWAKQFWKSIFNDFPEAINDPWWDQRAVLLYRDRRSSAFDAHANIVGWRLMNTWAKEDDGNSFIIHKAGGHAMGKYIDLLRLLRNQKKQ
jgi:hypothetical protein